MYLALGNAIGTLEARDLGQRLAAWHDSMVKHLRKASLRGTNCDDDCPHVDARLLWAEAVDVFGGEAQKLTFLRTHGAVPGDASHRDHDGGTRMTLRAGSPASFRMWSGGVGTSPGA